MKQHRDAFADREARSRKSCHNANKNARQYNVYYRVAVYVQKRNRLTDTSKLHADTHPATSSPSQELTSHSTFPSSYCRWLIDPTRFCRMQQAARIKSCTDLKLNSNHYKWRGKKMLMMLTTKDSSRNTVLIRSHHEHLYGIKNETTFVLSNGNSISGNCEIFYFFFLVIATLFLPLVRNYIARIKSQILRRRRSRNLFTAQIRTFVSEFRFRFMEFPTWFLTSTTLFLAIVTFFSSNSYFSLFSFLRILPVCKSGSITH